MPSLKTASVWFGCLYEDKCQKSCSAGSCGECLSCDGEIGRKRIDGCVLLGGLSNATDWKFRASFGTFTFKMDLGCCPTFSKLRTFYLVDWCLAGDLRALLCFLQHTPNLEKLTLELCQKERCVLEAEDTNPIEQSFSLRQLKIVEVKCVKIDERVQRTLKILSILGIIIEKFNIQNI